MEHHEKVIGQLIERYKLDKSVIAVNLFGSLARGTERHDSDVDIEIISDMATEWSFNTDEKIDGIIIDVVISPKDHLLNRVNNFPFLCYVHSKEKLLYDPTGFMQQVQAKLKEYFTKHPNVVEFWEGKYKIMKEKKDQGLKAEGGAKIYDEAELLFSPVKKVTRDFFLK